MCLCMHKLADHQRGNVKSNNEEKKEPTHRVPNLPPLQIEVEGPVLPPNNYLQSPSKIQENLYSIPTDEQAQSDCGLYEEEEPTNNYENVESPPQSPPRSTQAEPSYWTPTTTGTTVSFVGTYENPQDNPEISISSPRGSEAYTSPRTTTPRERVARSLNYKDVLYFNHEVPNDVRSICEI
jgi:hypothetical protein